MINRFNADLNMSERHPQCPELGAFTLTVTVDLTLPNHAVNVMFFGTGIFGSVILIIIAGPYVSAIPL